MRIFILVYNLTNGGAERVACLWANGFQNMGHEVTLILGDDQSPITYKPNDSIKIEYICSHKNSKIDKHIDRFRKLRNLINLFKPNLIIGVSPVESILAKSASVGKKIKIIHTEHNSFERPDSAPMSLITKFYKFFLNKVISYSGITVLTSADKKIIGRRLKKVFVLPNPCTFDPIDYSILPSKKSIILASGRLNVWHCKGFDYLIKAFAVAKKDISQDWILQIAGQGSMQDLEYLQNIAKNYGVGDSVEFLGYLPDIKNKYQEASVFVLSSRYEGFGMVLLEAMSQGCACVACDYKGRQSEILGNPPAGLLSEPENIIDIASKIVKVCNDAELRLKLQRAAITRSKAFSVDEIMSKWNSIISNI